MAVYHEDRPYKMALHKCLRPAPMSALGAATIQQIAVMIEPLYELMQAYRRWKMDRRLRRLPADAHLDNAILTSALDHLGRRRRSFAPHG